MKIKTEDLEGDALDHVVAQIEVAEGRFTADREDDTSGLPFLCGDTVFGVGFTRINESPHRDTGKRHVYHGPSHGNFYPSRDWAWGGPILERARIATSFIPTSPYPNSLPDFWSADMMLAMLEQQPEGDMANAYVHGYGPTPLIAAMRCYVASRLGAEVEVPDELLTGSES